MKVSVVIPAYNEERWIDKALEAISKQDYPDYEVIVVDNASQDRTSEVVAPYVAKDPRIKLIHEPRKGLLFAREAGRRTASGQIIAQMDADCIPKPYWISRAVRYFEDPTIVGVSGPYRLYDAPAYLRVSLTAITLLGEGLIYLITRFVTKLRDKREITVGGNFFIRATTLETIGGYDTSIDFYGEDTDTGYRLSQHGRLVHRRDIEIDSSARRHKAFGFFKLIYMYTKAYLTVISGKRVHDSEEINHPR